MESIEITKLPEILLYSLDKKRKQEFFLKQMLEVFDYHIDNCIDFNRMMTSLKYQKNDIQDTCRHHEELFLSIFYFYKKLKIESLNFTNKDGNDFSFDITIVYSDCIIRDEDTTRNILEIFEHGIDGNKIEATWRAVVKFIQWYNNQKR